MMRIVLVASATLALVSCGSSSAPALVPCPAFATTCSSGVVSGAQDNHCGTTTPSPPSTYSCPTTNPNVTANPNGNMSDYGATLYNNSGDDDDCKYHVAWVASNVQVNKPVEFQVQASWLQNGTPLTGAYALTEVFLSDTHPAPNSNSFTLENPNGTYTIAPVLFDEAGQWTVRFHFYSNCVDDGNSLHGHAAFYVNVP